MTTTPLPRRAGEVTVDPLDARFSAFVFKIQANMNRAHRDRIAFLRVCSGRFDRAAEYLHVREKKTFRLSRPQQMMAQEREVIDEAFAGDIIGVFDPGVFAIGDTVCDPALRDLRFDPIPTFTPEHFAVVEQIDSMKRKQFAKGMTQIAQEGVIRIFHEPGSGLERVVVGVVGTLQFDVLEYRMRDEYGVGYRRYDLPHTTLRRVAATDGFDPSALTLTGDTRVLQDFSDDYLLLFPGDWAMDWAIQKNPGLTLLPFDLPD